MSHRVDRACIAALIGITAYAPRVWALELDWQAPLGCPTADTILRDIRRLAGPNQGETLAARAQVNQTPDQRWRVVIELSGSASGHRALIADTCAQLGRASSLIIALAANPEAALDLPTEEPQSPTKASTPDVRRATPNELLPPQPPLPDSVAIAEPRSVGAPAREDAHRQGEVASSESASSPVELLSRAGFEWGALPTSTGWLGGGIRVRPASPPFGFALTGHVTQGTSATFTNGIGANFRSFAAQAQLCAEAALRGWLLAGCGGMQIAMVRAKGFANTELDSSAYSDTVAFTLHRWIPGPVLSINPRVELARLVLLEAGAELIVPLMHWQFVVENLATLFRPRELQYRVFLGLTIGTY